MISQAILVMTMIVLDIGQCSESKPMPTCPAINLDLAIPYSFDTTSASNLDYSFLDTCNYSYDPPSAYYSGSHANNFNSGDTFSEFSMSSTRNFDLPRFEKIVKGWKMFPIPVNDDLEWPLANLSCHEAQKNASSFQCRATNSECVDSWSGSGYYCKCSTGFAGNPYLVDGCHDIDECIVSEPCEGTCCTNLIGSDSCSSLSRVEDRWGYCLTVSHSLSLTSYYGLYCICLVSTVPAFVISWIISFSKKKKVLKLRRDLFIRNGGEILEAKQSVRKTLSIFTAEDLKKATNNYDDNNVLYEEDHLGITYKGVLRGVSSGVTIQCCYAFGRCKIEILIGKLVALSQISHANVVKLLGCCLETQVPLVVYELSTSKTLLDYINDNSLSWDMRLKVAADTAGAIAYLHSAMTVPIIHGSLNSSCILLDQGYTVKVSGFALTCSECSCVQFHGDTSIYLGPDCFSYGQLTEKSDVYSFGFILAELLTGKGVMSPEWLQIEEKLADFFAGSSGGGDLLEILDDRLVTGNYLGRLAQVAEIAKRCLSSSSHERPTMEEVAISLECVVIS